MTVTTALPQPAARWLFGPWRDLLFGCGLWYIAALGALAFVGPALREHGGVLALSFISLLVLTPHYGATLLRVYERARIGAPTRSSPSTRRCC